MIKKTKKNVARLKWFSFSMFILNGSNILLVAKLAADGYFENHILLGVILSCILPFSWLFWFMVYGSFEEMQDEMENKNGKEN